MTHVYITVTGTGPGAAAALLRLGRRGVRGVALDPGVDPGYDDELPHILSCHGVDALRRLGVWSEVAARAHRLTRVRLHGQGGRAVEAPLGAGGLWVLPPRWLESVLLRAAHEAGISEAPRGASLDTPIAVVDAPCIPDFRSEVVVLQRFSDVPCDLDALVLALGDDGARWIAPEGGGLAVVGAVLKATDAHAAALAFDGVVRAALDTRLGGAVPVSAPLVHGIPRPVTSLPNSLAIRAPDPSPSLVGDCGIDLTLETGLLAADHAARVALEGLDPREAAESYGRKARWLALPTDGVRWASDRLLRSHLARAAVTLASLPPLRRLVPGGSCRA